MPFGLDSMLEGTTAQPSPSLPHVSRTVLDKEADARFWAQTGYKPGQRLDPNDPKDRAMVKTWLDVFAKVKAEDAAGKLVLTYIHPQVKQHLQDAAVASSAAAKHLDTAAATPDHAQRMQHATAAATALQASATSAQKAAALQPPTASPAVVQASADEVHAAAAQPPPPPVVVPPSHPAHADHPKAHPNTHPANPAHAQPSPPAQVAHPRTGADHIAVKQAAAAPHHVIDVHMPGSGGSVAKPSIDPTALDTARRDGLAMASANPSPFQLYTRFPGEAHGKLRAFASFAELQQAWAQEIAVVAGGPGGEYVAVYENGEGPIADGISGETKQATLPSPPGTIAAQTQTSSAGAALGIGLAVAAGAGLIFLLAKTGGVAHATSSVSHAMPGRGHVA
jgi:hypothetical protein